MTSLIYFIARNEFYRVIGHPIVLLVSIIIVILTFVNGWGGVFDIEMVSIGQHSDGFIRGFSQVWYVTTFICTILAAFLGVTSISEERWNHSLNVLLVKPLYRRDVIIGKFMGLGVFILGFVILIMLVNTLTLLLFYGPPISLVEFLWRITAYIAILWMDCSLVLSLMLLVGALFKDFLLAVSIAITYISYEFFWNIVIGYISILIKIPLAPYTIAMKILDPLGSSDLFNTNVPFDVWFGAGSQYIALLLLLIVLVLLMSCFAFTRMEDR